MYIALGTKWRVRHSISRPPAKICLPWPLHWSNWWRHSLAELVSVVFLPSERLRHSPPENERRVARVHNRDASSDIMSLFPMRGHQNTRWLHVPTPPPAHRVDNHSRLIHPYLTIATFFWLLWRLAISDLFLPENTGVPSRSGDCLPATGKSTVVDSTPDSYRVNSLCVCGVDFLCVNDEADIFILQSWFPVKSLIVCWWKIRSQSEYLFLPTGNFEIYWQWPRPRKIKLISCWKTY